jgi:hypothetical protein
LWLCGGREPDFLAQRRIDLRPNFPVLFQKSSRGFPPLAQPFARIAVPSPAFFDDSFLGSQIEQIAFA